MQLYTLHQNNNNNLTVNMQLYTPQFLCVGTAKDLKLSPPSFSAAFIHVYRLAADGRSFTFEHKTVVDEVPLAMCAFKGQLLAGCGRTVSSCGFVCFLRVYLCFSLLRVFPLLCVLSLFVDLCV
jgi:hypothetical protein